MSGRHGILARLPCARVAVVLPLSVRCHLERDALLITGACPGALAFSVSPATVYAPLRVAVHLSHFASSTSSPLFFFFNDTAPPEIYPLSLHDPLPISSSWKPRTATPRSKAAAPIAGTKAGAPPNASCPLRPTRPHKPPPTNGMRARGA